MKPILYTLLASSLIVPAGAVELLTDGDFELGGYGWEYVINSTLDQVSFEERSAGWGVDAVFSLNSSLLGDPWDAQLLQFNLAVQSGYRYTVSFGGSATAEGSKWVDVGIQHNGGSSYYYGDGSDVWTVYDSLSRTLTTDYADFSKSWDNCSVNDSKVQFFIQVGRNTRDVNIAWASLDRTPITCGGSSSSSILASSSSGVVFSSSSGVTPSSSSLSPSNGLLRMNQIGFHPLANKQAVLIQGTNDPIVIKNGLGEVVATLQPSAASTWSPSGESARLIQFPSLSTDAQTYTIHQGSSQIGRTLNVKSDVYTNLLKGVLKFYYFQRASTALSSTYAGSYARSAGHADQSISRYYVGGGSTFSSPKGWYDAGDYGKYIVNSGISTSTLLSLYEHYSTWFNSLEWNIPESGNGKADLLDEIRWNLDWMLTMQDADGGVYSKLTTAVFSGSVMPSADVATRYAFMKTTAASYDFAAVMAQASRIYASTDAVFASSCLLAARNAYAWAKSHPAVYYSQPAGVNTGEYGDNTVSDEAFWAATEMYLATQESAFQSDYRSYDISPSTPDWAGVGTLGYYSMALHPSVFGNDASLAQDSLVKKANALRTVAKSGGYALPIQSSDFVWGSNSVLANQGIVLLHAYYLTKNEEYLQFAQSALDYLLGRNPLDYAYVTGFGAKSPKNPHHRPSEADGISNPVPGMIVGGPHTGGQDVGIETWQCGNYVLSGKPAMSYYDNTCSYATNEVAINWNASMSYLVGALQAIYQGESFLGKVIQPVRVISITSGESKVESKLRFDGHGMTIKGRDLVGRRAP